MMNNAFKAMRTVVLTTALMASVSGVASADDNGMSRLGGDGYAYFHQDKPIVDKSPSTFRESHPNGLSEHQFEALSSEGLGYTFQVFAFDRAPSEWRRSHPNGLSEGELQALSSNSNLWQLPNRAQASALASTNRTAAAQTAAN
jgi:hypothetical protein